MLSKLINLIRHKPVKALLLFYAVLSGLTVAVCLALALFAFIAGKAGYFQRKALNLNDFEQIGVEQLSDMSLVNATEDTQLIYKNNAYNLYVKCTFSYEPGEFILFYSKSPEGGFGINNMTYARKQGDYYVFNMPFNTKSFRLDTGIHPSITVKFEEIILNETGFFDLFRINTGTLFYLLVIPPILYGIFASITELYDKIKSKFKKPVS